MNALSRSGRWGANAALLGAAAIIALPLLFVANTALRTPEAFLRAPVALAEALRLENFIQAWTEAKMGQYFANTIVYTVVGVFLICLVNLLAAFPLARSHIRGANLLYGLFVAGMFMPGSLPALLYLMKALHLYNEVVGYLLLLAGQSIPINILILAGFIRTVPRELDEAAAIDGCGYFRYVFTLLPPMIKPALATVIMLNGIGIWNDFINPLIFLVGPSKRTLTSGLYIFFGQYSTEWTTLAAGVLIIILPLVVGYVFLQRYIIAGITSGALKG